MGPDEQIPLWPLLGSAWPTIERLLRQINGERSVAVAVGAVELAGCMLEKGSVFMMSQARTAFGLLEDVLERAVRPAMFQRRVAEAALAALATMAALYSQPPEAAQRLFGMCVSLVGADDFQRGFVPNGYAVSA